MIGHPDAPKLCPLCGGQLSVELATIPFVLGRSMAVIKQVPAEVCDTCAEPFLHAEAADVVSLLLDTALASNGGATGASGYLLVPRINRSGHRES